MCKILYYLPIRLHSPRYRTQTLYAMRCEAYILAVPRSTRSQSEDFILPKYLNSAASIWAYSSLLLHGGRSPSIGRLHIKTKIVLIPVVCSATVQYELYGGAGHCSLCAVSPPRPVVFALPSAYLTRLAVQVLAYSHLLTSIQSSTGCAGHLSRQSMYRRTRRVISIPSTS